ncbi:hypothetical protein N9544_01845 [Flavobacteriales bacterium]|nr:hypothetical protein [Flavobacteriales bacterium]
MKKKLNYILFLVSLIGYLFIYYGIDRSQFFKLILGVSILGIVYFYWLKIKSLSVKQILVLAIIFRVLLLFDSPNFSDDYNRFLWDGIVLTEGINPYENTPKQLIENKEISIDNLDVLYDKLNSQGYYTVYPPMNQFFFSSSIYLSNNNLKLGLFIMKLIILLFDIGLIYILMRILRMLKLKENLAQIYALNPLVILELTGNVHFEGVMLFFLFFGIYFIINNKILIASIFIGSAISVKLVPLLILPLLLPLIGLKKSLKLYIGIGVTTLILVLPFISQQVINNFSLSLELYFQSFEFNASFYYLLKGLSHLFLGYKTSFIGILTPIVVFVTAIYFTFSLYKKTLNNADKFDLRLFAEYSSLLLFVFYLLASTIHPWYIINIVIFSIFITNRAYLLWSLLTFLSYFAYSNIVKDFAPNSDFHSYNWYYLLVSIEYVIVIFFFIFENRKQKVTNIIKSL